MAHVLRGSHSLHTSHSPANRMNHICLCLLSWRWSSFTDHKGTEGWVGLGGRLDTEINARKLNPDTVTHLSTNRARHWLTLLTETNAIPLHQTTTLNRKTDIPVTLCDYLYSTRSYSFLHLKKTAHLQYVCHVDCLLCQKFEICTPGDRFSKILGQT